MLTPDHYYRTVRDIDLDALKASGIDTLLIDLDNTLLPRDCEDVPADLKAWVDDVVSRDFHVCIVSNNWHVHVPEVAAKLGLQLVAKAIKPLPFAFRKALSILGSSPERAAVVGDQLFTDVLGGRLLGMRTVLVMPLSATDLPHTLLLRRIERIVLADKRPLP